ncbi:MAG: 16S rRNA (guanine(966)-N(2))-methyltransferase RsmD [Candidatus Nanopelagicales bacterium]
MTRIVAGAARGHQLKVPPRGTRPTADRVREAMFNSIEHELGGLAAVRVLDLFAGSGALGLEAVSRGADEAVLVESDRVAAAVARANCEALRRPLTAVGRTATLTVAAVPVAAYLGGEPAPFGLVLADPPYALDTTALTALLTRLGQGWLAPGALVVVERSARGSDLTWPAPLIQVRHKRYSETAIWYGRHAEAPAGVPAIPPE